MNYGDKHKDQKLFKKDKAENKKEKKVRLENERIETEVKDAHASGIGALGRSEENQIEKQSSNKLESDDAVY